MTSKIKKLAVVVELEDGIIRQIMLDKEERKIVLDLIKHMHSNTIKIFDQGLNDGIEISD